MRNEVSIQRIRDLMTELARTAPRRGDFRVYLVGGGTAVLLGWRASSVDVDLYSDQEVLFKNIQDIKARLNINIEFARPEDFVPALKGAEDRHQFIDKLGTVSFFHYDPYSQLFSKIVRGFQRDMEDARQYITSGMVEAPKFQSLVAGIPAAAWARYPTLSRRGVQVAVEAFLSQGA